MTYSYTATSTYTTIDVNRVLDCFAADFDMIAQSTGLRTRENVKLVTSDIRQMAIANYLEEVNLYLINANGVTIKAAKYQVFETTSSSNSEKPSQNLWTSCPGGSLMVHVTYNNRWSDLTKAQQEAFIANYQLHWGTNNLDTSFPMLSNTANQVYSSNAYGLKKVVFS